MPVFLDVLRRRNPALIEAAIALHQTGRIPANSTVIDLDAVADNAALIKAAADKAGLRCFAMTKQMGRNGDLCRAVKKGASPRRLMSNAPAPARRLASNSAMSAT